MVNCTHTIDSSTCFVCSLLNKMYSEKRVERDKIPWLARTLMGILRTQVKGVPFVIKDISGDIHSEEVSVNETTRDLIQQFLNDTSDVHVMNTLIQNLRLLYNNGSVRP